MSTAADTQRLLTKADWHQWFNSVSRRARRDNIWKYCNPTLTQTSSPAAPPAAASLQNALVLQELVQPIRPRPSDINATATQLSDLTDAELKRWAIIKDDYNDLQRDYAQKSKALAELDNYIESTIDRSNLPIIKDLVTPYEKLKALKQKLEPTSKQLKQSARAKYESARKWNSRTKLDTWLRDYRNAYLEAKAVKLSVVDDYNAHYDFV